MAAGILPVWRWQREQRNVSPGAVLPNTEPICSLDHKTCALLMSPT
jgi:hypothetical protein